MRFQNIINYLTKEIFSPIDTFSKTHKKFMKLNTSKGDFSLGAGSMDSFELDPTGFSNSIEKVNFYNFYKLFESNISHFKLMAIMKFKTSKI